MIKVLIFDDNEIRREGLRLLLSTTGPCQWMVVDALPRAQALQSHSGPAANVILFSTDGSRAITWAGILPELKSVRRGIPILTFSSAMNESETAVALRAGVSGMVVLSSMQELSKAICQVASGNTYFSPCYHSLVENKSQTAPHHTLTCREFQVLLAFAQGDSTKEIAYDLNLSVKTISVYRTKIMEKLNLRGTAGIALYAIENGLIKPEKAVTVQAA